MRIYIITEQYPSLYKPYLDTQFEQFVRDGHEVQVYALGPGRRAAAGGHLPLHQATRYLPTDRRSLPRFGPRILGSVLAAPGRRLAALGRARRARPPRVETLTDAARLAVLPAAPPDLCLVHNLLAARRVKFLRDLYPGVPIAVYYHGGELPGVPAVSDKEAAQAFAAADVVFTNTAKSRDHAVARGCSAGAIVVSPMGFRLEDYPATAGRRYRRGGRLNVLTIARLSPEKGVGYGIEAIRRVVAAGRRDLRYRIVGGGPLAAELAGQVAAAGLAQYVELLGPLSRDRLVEELAGADVLVLPSIVIGTWEENQACVVQEAMLMQLLVIASATGGVPESLAPVYHPFLTPEADAAAIASSLERIAALTEGELAEMGAAGRAFARDRYDIRSLNRRIITESLRRRDAANRVA